MPLHTNADMLNAQGTHSARRGYGMIESGKLLADGGSTSNVWRPMCMEASSGASHLYNALPLRDNGGPSSVQDCVQSSDAVVLQGCARGGMDCMLVPPSAGVKSAEPVVLHCAGRPAPTSWLNVVRSRGPSQSEDLKLKYFEPMIVDGLKVAACPVDVKMYKKGVSSCYII